MMLFGAKDQTEEILNRYLDRDFYVAAAGKNAPTKERLKEVAARFGCSLPKDFIAHSTGRLGGIYVEVKEEIWPRPPAYAVGPFWSFLYAVFVYGLGDEIPEWMNMELKAAEFEEATGHRLLPCLKRIGDADFYLFDEQGRIVQWNHESGELEPFDGSFFELFEQEIRELRERKDLKVKGEDKK
jgi:hypothetical protein